MEMRKVYTKDGMFTGRIEEKHAPMRPGDYFLHAIIILKTEDGGYIMQQRSLKARHCPGKWDVTGGGTAADETTAQTAVREAYEELGVTVEESALKHCFREVMTWESGVNGIIVDTYAARVKVPEGGFRIAEREVNDVKVVDFDEFLENVMYNKSDEFRKALVRIDREI